MLYHICLYFWFKPSRKQFPAPLESRSRDGDKVLVHFTFPNRYFQLGHAGYIRLGCGVVLYLYALIKEFIICLSLNFYLKCGENLMFGTNQV